MCKVQLIGAKRFWVIGYTPAKAGGKTEEKNVGRKSEKRAVEQSYSRV
jgi:hypothetical protein